MTDDRCNKIARFIADSTRRTGAPPTVRDIADHMQRSVSVTHRYLLRCEKEGVLRKTRRRGNVEWEVNE